MAGVISETKESFHWRSKSNKGIPHFYPLLLQIGTYINLKFVALRVPEIIGGIIKKIWAVPGYAHAPFSPKFFMGLCSDGPYEYICLIWSPYSFSRSWDNSDCSFWGGVVNPESRGSEGRRGSGMVPFEREFVTSYRPSIVTFPLSLRVSEILSLLCSSTPLFPTPRQISPCSPGNRWVAFGLRRAKVLG